MGLGSKLLKAAEAEAKGRGCGFAHLDTMSFQAKGFYEKNGYSVKYEIKDIPKGFSKYLMIKELK